MMHCLRNVSSYFSSNVSQVFARSQTEKVAPSRRWVWMAGQAASSSLRTRFWNLQVRRRMAELHCNFLFGGIPSQPSVDDGKERSTSSLDS